MASSATHGEHRGGRKGGWGLAQLVLVGLVFRKNARQPARPAPRSPGHAGAAPGQAAARASHGETESVSDKPQASRHAPPSAAQEPGRGRQADTPKDIPARGWKDIAIRTFKEFGDDQIPLISAGITFYALLALFPALAALVSLYGLFADPAEVPGHLQRLAFFLPGDALTFLGEQMTRISATHTGGLSFGFVFGLLLSLWSANGAMKATLAGLNIAYDEKEKRNFIKKTLTSLAFTVAAIVFVISSMVVIGAAPAIETFVGKQAATVFGLVTWPLVVVGLGLGLALLYRYGPSRDRVKWQWLSWGSAAALALWLAFSAAFSLYLANFADYNKTYGSLGAAMGFMMWIYFSSQVILLGAELNSEIEHQTAKDTTVGPDAPMGERGAVMADTIGQKQGR
jgi:membrane protein